MCAKIIIIRTNRTNWWVRKNLKKREYAPQGLMHENLAARTYLRLQYIVGGTQKETPHPRLWIYDWIYKIQGVFCSYPGLITMLWHFLIKSITRPKPYPDKFYPCTKLKIVWHVPFPNSLYFNDCMILQCNKANFRIFIIFHQIYIKDPWCVQLLTTFRHLTLISFLSFPVAGSSIMVLALCCMSILRKKKSEWRLILRVRSPNTLPVSDKGSCKGEKKRGWQQHVTLW